MSRSGLDGRLEGVLAPLTEGGRRHGARVTGLGVVNPVVLRLGHLGHVLGHGRAGAALHHHGLAVRDRDLAVPDRAAPDARDALPDRPGGPGAPGMTSAMPPGVRLSGPATGTLA